MTKRILVVALGGTIGSVKGESIGLDENNLKILDYCKRDDVVFESISPFSVLSENMTPERWQELIDFLAGVNFGEYIGVIILHGSDTLAFTSAVIANAFCDESIVLVAADKPIEDESSNGIKNFNSAVVHLLAGEKGVFVSYNRIMKALGVTSAGIDDEFDCIESCVPAVKGRKINNKNVLIINSYVGINIDNYNFDNADAVLIGMYHSATVPVQLIALAEKASTPVYFVTHKSSAEYETAQGIKNIIFGSTMENAYAQLLLM